jgi:hypothetical protein
MQATTTSDIPAMVAMSTRQTIYVVSISKKVCAISIIALSVTAVPVNMEKVKEKGTVKRGEMMTDHYILLTGDIC